MISQQESVTCWCHGVGGCVCVLDAGSEVVAAHFDFSFELLSEKVG